MSFAERHKHQPARQIAICTVATVSCHAPDMLFLKARPTCPAVAARRSGRAPLQCRAAGTPPAMRTFEAPAASPQTPASAPASASTTASPSSAAAPARDPATTSPYRVSLWSELHAAARCGRRHQLPFGVQGACPLRRQPGPRPLNRCPCAGCRRAEVQRARP